MPPRTVLLALASAAASALMVGAGAGAAHAAAPDGAVTAPSPSVSTLPAATPGGTPSSPPALAAGDRLTIEVSNAGEGQNGTFELRCNAEGGTTYSGDHPRAREACERLGSFSAGGDNPFAPTSKRALCTMQYGGPATAHITGMWRGRSVDSRFSRADGCEIARWNAAVPILPELAPTA
ncbi:SSI family serine proteinase inhibitor [Streptomyces sp. NPDC050560]|uniref:SSI family serine proteinase inhibitor n=1 Tax=Streptomyces sp. NPDC050560 TaxID=3365630 RepID=UPI003795276D